MFLNQSEKFLTWSSAISVLLAVNAANGCMQCSDHKVKDCCAAVGGSSSTVKYDEATYQCGNTLAFGNVVNQGAMTNVVVNTKLVLAPAK